MGTLLLIGETLNSTRPSVKRILEERDAEAFLSLAAAQVEGGASCIDINASMLMEKEEEALRWGASAVRETLDIPIMLDSPNVEILVHLALTFGGGVILNSLTCDEETMQAAFPAVKSAGAGVVVMLKDRHGIPAAVEERLSLAARAASTAIRVGVPEERLFLDPVFSPLATSGAGLLDVLDTLRGLAARFPRCQRIGGLSNVSFGLPERKLFNRAFAAMAIAAGASALICDTRDRDLMRTIKASEALAGEDPRCRRFLDFYRSGRSGT